jgi:hypothetical protein
MMMTTNDSKQKVEQKIGESLGLEMAAQEEYKSLVQKAY